MQHRSNETPSPRIALIVGGNGKTGRRVADRLDARGIETRRASRSGATRFDWDDPATWEPALAGATMAYVTYAPDLAVPQAPEAIRRFARLADALGIGRLVLLSGRGEEAAQVCERIVQEIRPDWTVVRASWFLQNFDEGFFLEPLRQGTLALPAGEVREPFIDIEDIADVAVAALTGPGHEGRIYEVTGPRSITFAEAVAEIAAAAGRDLRYLQVPTEEFVGGLRADGVPGPVVALTRYLFETVLDGRNERTADGVEQALGRPPRDLASYARRVARTGVWDAPSPADTVRRFVDRAINRGDESVLGEVVHADYVYRAPGEELRGRDGLAARLRGYRAAFPDLHVEIDTLVAAGDTTVLEFTLTGTHRGALLGIPATGRPVKIHGMVRSRFRDGRIADEWEILDQLALFEQLGVSDVAGAAT